MPPVNRKRQYLVNRVAEVKLIFIALLIATLATAEDTMKITAAFVTITSIAT